MAHQRACRDQSTGCGAAFWLKFRADRTLWRTASTFGDLCELTAQWLEGRIAYRPGYVPGYGPDPGTTQTPGLARALGCFPA